MIDGEELIAAEPEEFARPRLDELEAASMCYTSGTTGRPKGVVYSHRAIVLHSLASALTDGLAIGQREVVCPVVPMFHVNAWGLPFTATMAGCKQVLPGPHLDPESLLDLYAQEGVTLTAGVPTIWLGILQALDKEPGRWKLVPDLRMVVGGSAAPEAMIRAFDKHGLRVVHAWGMTEMSPVGSVSQLGPNASLLSDDERYAVRAGGGVNHRAGLYDAVLIKDNHIAAIGGIADAIERARASSPAGTIIEAECDTLDQVRAALAARADSILLDNMNVDSMTEAVRLTRGAAIVEASGGVNLSTVRAVAATGVDVISVGALTPILVCFHKLEITPPSNFNQSRDGTA